MAESIAVAGHVRSDLTTTVAAAAAVLARVAGTDRATLAGSTGLPRAAGQNGAAGQSGAAGPPGSASPWEHELPLPRHTPFSRVVDLVREWVDGAVTVTVRDRDGGVHRAVLRQLYPGRTSLVWSTERFAGIGLSKRVTHVLGRSRALPDTPLADLPVLTQAESRCHTALAQASAVEPVDASRELRRHATDHPDAPAIVDGNTVLSYSELDAAVTEYARGVRPGRLVRLVQHRSAALVVAILGALRAGATFTILHPRTPAVRLTELVADASTDTAYVLFTSGSTGRPKRVGVTYRALGAYLATIGPAYDLAPGDRVLQLAEPGFDVLLEEVLPTIVAGACVHIAEPDCLDSPERFRAFVARRGVTVLNLPSSLWLTLFRRAGSDEFEPPPPSVRLVVVGSERVPPAAFMAWHRSIDVPLVHAYGTTETTITSLIHRAGDNTDSVVRRTAALPIGHPLPHTWVRVVDPQGDPTPFGVPGELIIGGPGHESGYRTGDLSYVDKTGALILLGRLDGQLKVRGHRIEPAEVEAALEDLPGVRAAACTAAGHDESARLVAAVAPAPGAAVNPTTLAERLRAVLPEWLVPQQFLVLPKLPLGPTGKVDRAAIRALAGRASTGADRAACRTPTEHAVATAIARLLNRPAPAPGDNFFALGGNSLQAIRLVAELTRELGGALPARQVFLTPTVAEIAGALDATFAELGQGLIVRRSERGTFPLTPGQRGMLRFLSQVDNSRPYFEMFEAFRITGPLDPSALCRALRTTVRENEPLRSLADPAAGTQRVLAENDPSIVEVDLGDRREALEDELWAARRPFDLRIEPGFRAVLLRLGPDEHVLSLCFHHVFFDGWSYGLVYQRLAELYAEYTAGRPVPEPPPRPEFGDYALRLAAETTDEARAADIRYWRKELAGYQTPDACRLDAPDCTSTAAGHLIDLSLATGLERVAASVAATPFALMTTAFTIVLGRLVGQPDLLIASNDANRYHAGTERMIGYLSGSLLARVRLSAEDSFRTAVAGVHRTLAAGRLRMSMPPEELVTTIGLPGAVQFRFSLQDTPGAGALHLSGLWVEHLPEPVEARGKRAVVVTAWRRPQGYEVQWYARDDVRLPTPPAGAVAGFGRVLAAAVDHPEWTVAALAEVAQ